MHVQWAGLSRLYPCNSHAAETTGPGKGEKKMRAGEGKQPRTRGVMGSQGRRDGMTGVHGRRSGLERRSRL